LTKKSKRKHGTGSVWAYRGKWRAEVMLDGERRNLGVHDTEAEALRAVKAAVQLHSAKAAELPSSLTLRDWGDAWLARRQQDGVRGIRRERSRWKRHILNAPFADRPLKRIDTADVVSWVRGLMQTEAADAVTSPLTGKTELREKGSKLSRQTVQHCYSLLRLAFADALQEGRVRSNPCDGVKVPKVRSAKKDAWTFLTAAEVKLATGPEVDEPYRTIYTVAIYVGCRREDIWKLLWSDVVLSGEHPRIHIREPKNDKPREVPLLGPPLDALRRWRDQRPGVGTAPVFPQLTGKNKGKRHPDTYDGRWRDYYGAEGKRMPGWCRRAGIARHVRFHDLRHTCASHLVMGTWMPALSLYEVRDWMGHSSISVTQRYAHLAPEGLRGKVKRAREEQS
jgi:integrase